MKSESRDDDRSSLHGTTVTVVVIEEPKKIHFFQRSLISFHIFIFYFIDVYQFQIAF